MRAMSRFRARARRWCPRLVAASLVGTAAVPGLGGVLDAGTPTILDIAPEAGSGAFTLGWVALPEPTTTTTTVAPPSSAPAAPRSPRAGGPDVVLGSIEIPTLGISLPLRQGIALATIDKGPSHWPGTALPGTVGNVVVAGHRVTHGAPFRHIDRLQPGDPVVFTVGGRRSTYRVIGHDVVTPDAMHIVAPTPTPTATLFACHPPGSARYRYVVELALESVT